MMEKLSVGWVCESVEKLAQVFLEAASLGCMVKRKGAGASGFPHGMAHKPWSPQDVELELVDNVEFEDMCTCQKRMSAVGFKLEMQALIQSAEVFAEHG